MVHLPQNEKYPNTEDTLCPLFVAHGLVVELDVLLVVNVVWVDLEISASPALAKFQGLPVLPVTGFGFRDFHRLEQKAH